MTTQTAGQAGQLSSIVAANVRAQAAMRGWTQTQLAMRLGVSKMAVSDRYRERTPWSLDEVARLADLFGLEVAELVARPKGFEPLTFWLGAHHTITATGVTVDKGYRDCFCDLCGEARLVLEAAHEAEQWAMQHASDHHKRDAGLSRLDRLDGVVLGGVVYDAGEGL